MLDKLEFEKNGPGYIDSAPFDTEEGEMYIRSEDSGETWTLLMATDGCHYDDSNPLVTNAKIDQIERFIEKFINKI